MVFGVIHNGASTEFGFHIVMLMCSNLRYLIKDKNSLTTTPEPY